jgi:RNA polymerase sigma-70 factor (ECF subfamily)
VPNNDLDLLARIKRHDPSAIGDLYDRYGKTAYAVILRIVPDAGVAEDLLAETFVTVWNQIARWKDARMEDLRLWLLLLARNHAIERLRSQNEPLPKALPRLGILEQPAILQDFPRPRNAESWSRLRAAFASLTATETRILEMACFDGKSPSEIALHLGLPLAAVKESIGSATSKITVQSK